jgi:hypothetical protein
LICINIYVTNYNTSYKLQNEKIDSDFEITFSGRVDEVDAEIAEIKKVLSAPRSENFSYSAEGAAFITVKERHHL